MNILDAVGKGVEAITKTVSPALAKAGSSGASVSIDAALKGNFLNLLISQITNQNPLEPMDNETMVTQMTQFQTVEKLNALQEKIGSMMIYQNLMNSSNMLGKTVKIYDPSTNTTISGKVEGIRIENGFPGVVVGGNYYDVTNVQEVK